MSCKDCTCSTCIDIRIDQFNDAFRNFISAGYELMEAWNEHEVRNYPSYLPSFDEFIFNFEDLMEPTP